MARNMLSSMSEQEKNLKLIACIKNNPCLYDTTIDEYTSLDERSRAWSSVSKAVGSSVATCKTRWKHMRTVLTRHLKQRMERPPSCIRRKYYLEDYLEFLLPFLNPAKKILPPVAVVDSLQEVDLNDCREATSVQPKVEIISYEDDPEREGSPSAISESSESFDPQFADSLLETQQSVETDNRAQPINSHVQKNVAVKTASTLITEESANRRFLLSIEPDMDEMTPQQRRRFKLEVMEVIDRIFQDPLLGT